MEDISYKGIEALMKRLWLRDEIEGSDDDKGSSANILIKTIRYCLFFSRVFCRD
jgi:hypothetical protein